MIITDLKEKEPIDFVRVNTSRNSTAERDNFDIHFFVGLAVGLFFGALIMGLFF